MRSGRTVQLSPVISLCAQDALCAGGRYLRCNACDGATVLADGCNSANGIAIAIEYKLHKLHKLL
jgi:hypothetical protein